MNLQQIAKKHKISENYLNSRDDGFDISIESLNQLIFDIKKGSYEPEDLIYKLEKLKTFMKDIRNSTF